MTIADTYQILLRTSKLIGYKKSQRFGQRGRSKSAHDNRNFVLAQKGANENKENSDVVPGKNGATNAEIKCYACNICGHFAD